MLRFGKVAILLSFAAAACLLYISYSIFFPTQNERDANIFSDSSVAIFQPIAPPTKESDYLPRDTGPIGQNGLIVDSSDPVSKLLEAARSDDFDGAFFQFAALLKELSSNDFEAAFSELLTLKGENPSSGYATGYYLGHLNYVPAGDPFFDQFLAHWGAIDPLHAIEVISKLPNPLQNWVAYSRYENLVLSGWVTIDPYVAWDWGSKSMPFLPDDVRRPFLHQRLLAMTNALTDSQQFAVAGELVRRDDGVSYIMADRVSEAWGMSDLIATSTWLSSLDPMATVREFALRGFAKAVDVVMGDEIPIDDVVDALGTADRAIFVTGYLEKLAATGRKAEAVKVVSGVIDRYPEYDWSYVINRYFSVFAAGRTPSDSVIDGEFALLGNIPSGYQGNAAAKAFITRAQYSDPALAIVAVTEFFEHKDQAPALQRIIDSWLESDPETARVFLLQYQNVDQDVRAQLRY